MPEITRATTGRIRQMPTQLQPKPPEPQQPKPPKKTLPNKSIDGTFASNSDVKFPTEKAVKTYVDASATTSSAALNAEITRATTAETANAKRNCN